MTVTYTDVHVVKALLGVSSLWPWPLEERKKPEKVGVGDVQRSHLGSHCNVGRQMTIIQIGTGAPVIKKAELVTNWMGKSDSFPARVEHKRRCRLSGSGEEDEAHGSGLFPFGLLGLLT